MVFQLFSLSSKLSTPFNRRVLTVRYSLIHQKVNWFTMASSSVSQASETPSNDFVNVFSEANKIRTLVALESRGKGFRIPQCISDKLIRKAAVLIPLCINMNGEPCFLYTLRSLKLSKHRGEICFPGGVQDPEDSDEVATALRETQEELNISKESIEIWSVLHTMPTATTLMGVTPVLGLIKEPLDTETLKVNPEEVEKAFTVTFKHLCDKENWGHTQLIKGFGMPIYKNMKVYHPPDQYSQPLGLSSSSDDEDPGNQQPRDVRLWGLTAILTHVVLEALLPKTYTRRTSSPLLKFSSSKQSGPPGQGPSKI